MPRLTKGILFCLLAALCAVLEILLVNSPFSILSHIRVSMGFFVLAYILSADSISILSIPCATLILEQFSSVPFGILTTGFAVAISGGLFLAKQVITNRSPSAVVVVTASVVAIFNIWTLLARLITGVAPTDTIGQFIYSTLATSALPDTIITTIVVTVMFVLITRLSHRWNPRYIGARTQWQ